MCRKWKSLCKEICFKWNAKYDYYGIRLYCNLHCVLQVCQQLGIIELDYFGLQYIGEKGEQLWLNLRN